MHPWFDPPIGNVPWRGGAPAGGWRRNGGKAEGVNQGDLLAQEPVGWSPGNYPRTAASERAGVRAPIVATKGRNGPGAKGAQEGGCGTRVRQNDLRGECREAKPTERGRASGAGSELSLWS